PAKPWEGSDLSDTLLGSYRFSDGFERGDRVEHLTHRNRIGRAAGNCVGKGFEVRADRVDGWEAQMLRLSGAAPQHELGPAERFGRGVAAKGVYPQIHRSRPYRGQGSADACVEFE